MMDQAIDDLWTNNHSLPQTLLLYPGLTKKPLENNMKKRRIIWDRRVGSWFNMGTNTYSPGFPGTGLGFTLHPPQVDNNGWDMADVPRLC